MYSQNARIKKDISNFEDLASKKVFVLKKSNLFIKIYNLFLIIFKSIIVIGFFPLILINGLLYNNFIKKIFKMILILAYLIILIHIYFFLFNNDYLKRININTPNNETIIEIDYKDKIKYF